MTPLNPQNFSLPMVKNPPMSWLPHPKPLIMGNRYYPQPLSHLLYTSGHLGGKQGIETPLLMRLNILLFVFFFFQKNKIKLPTRQPMTKPTKIMNKNHYFFFLENFRSVIQILH